MDTVKPVKMFVFAGRKHNLEIQLPYIKRILAENENTTFDIWNLTRNSEDSDYVNSVSGERITVMNNFAGMEPHLGWNRVYDYYTSMKFRDHLFTKFDDDCLFVTTHRFAEFIQAVEDHPDTVISAQVINNGACTALEPGLQAGFEALNIPLLDVHEHASYADMAHDWLFANWREAINQPMELVNCDEWLSINWVGFNYHMNRQISVQLGRKSPPHIAGRDFTRKQKLGDEGMVNMLPRKILKGMVVGHASFGPQNLPDYLLSKFRSGYVTISKEYLGENMPRS